MGESVKFAAPVDEEWKKKKNYGPTALLADILLGMAYLAGNLYGGYNAATTSASASVVDMGAMMQRPSDACGFAVAPTSCPSGQTLWSVAGFSDAKGAKCLEGSGYDGLICGEL